MLLEAFISEVIGEKFKLNELTVSPKYQSRGVFNPFYVVDDSVDKQVRDLLNDKDITFNNVIYKAVDDVENDPIISTGKSSFELHTDEDTSLNVFIKIPKNKVKAHYGQKTRKDTTASSNVNEFLSLYFLLHPEFSTVEDLANKDGGTGVLTGEGDEVSYAQLISLIEKDETPERDIKIGINNAKALKQDLKDKSYKNLYWTPRAKPANINPKNPSDIIIQLDSGDFIGYSNKISDGEEKAIEDFDITKEAYSETKSRDAFADLAIQFQLDDLEFYTKDFYYIFRNNLITSLAKYLEDPINLKYFLNTIAGYTYGTKVEGETPCPYKLLVGSESGSTIKDVSENQVLRSVVTVDSSDDIKDIKNEYDGNSQSFRINFKLELADEKIDVTIPVTVRTRASGGWGGKSLYITSQGIKIN